MNRENEILNLIRQNPMITQDEIAEKLGIKRSTVGVHISRLEKKGIIRGRGYLINEDTYVAGVGSLNLDIYGKSSGDLKIHYDHPGHISANIGGVTHNIMENLSRLQVPVRFVTAAGNDLFGKILLNECREAGIDVSESVEIEDASSGVFMQILDDKNDMYRALTEMRVFEHLTPEFLKSRMPMLCGAAAVVCDPALPVESLKFLTELPVPVFIDPTSEALAEKIRDLAGGFYFIKPNLKELSVLTGMEVHDEKSVMKAGKALLEKGTGVVCVSMGEKGCIYMDAEGHYYKRKLKPVRNMVNASGAGDAFMAAMVCGHVRHMDTKQMIDHAMAAGIAAVMSEKVINPAFSADLIETILKERKK